MSASEDGAAPGDRGRGDEAREDGAGERSAAHVTSEVLSIVSHDIRAPLGVILGAIAELGDTRMGALTDEQRNLVRLVRRGSERLSRLAANVQFLARAETGPLALARQPLDARDLARRAAESFERSGETGKVTLALDLPSARAEIHAEADLAGQAVINVLANAVRFARSQVTFAVVTEGETTTLTIDDDGPGVPADTLARLFDPRARRRAEGMSTPRGLGLLIVKAIVDAHGASVTVENRLGDGDRPVGARVRLAFPRAS